MLVSIYFISKYRCLCPVIILICLYVCVYVHVCVYSENATSLVDSCNVWWLILP